MVLAAISCILITNEAIAGVLALVAGGLWLVNPFVLRSEIRSYFREKDGRDVKINPVLTVLFSSVYLNYCIA